MGAAKPHRDDLAATMAAMRARRDTLRQMQEAAPLLLDALSDALDSLEYVAKVAPELSGYGVRSDVIRAGRRAIAAAKGEA